MKILKLIFLLFFVTSYCQESIFSKYAKTDLDYDRRTYLKLLQIENKDALLLKIEKKRFITFEESVAYRFYIDWDKSINKKKLSASETLLCFNYLETLKSINPYNLSVTKQVKIDSLNAIEYTDVQDETPYRLNIFKNNLTVGYETYSPQFYIEQKFPFYKEREKLLKAYKYFDSLFEEAEATKNCGVIHEILNSQKFLENFKVNQRRVSDIYLLENDLCNLNLKINNKLNIVIVKKEQLRKDMNCLFISSVKNGFNYKMIIIDYPIKNVVFNAFIVGDKIMEVKVLKSRKK